MRDMIDTTMFAVWSIPSFNPYPFHADLANEYLGSHGYTNTNYMASQLYP